MSAGSGGGGGDGVLQAGGPPLSLELMLGEAGGVGSLGFLLEVEPRGKVLFPST